MKKNDNKLIIFSILLYIIICIIIYEFYQSFNYVSIGLFFVATTVYVVGIMKNKLLIRFIGYIIALLTVLFIRETNDYEINLHFYLNDWLKYVLTNKEIFINVVGNIILFIPLYFYLMKYISKWLSLLLVLLAIIISELLQYLLSLGVMDIVDIILNSLGVIISAGIYEVLLWNKSHKKREIKKESD